MKTSAKSHVCDHCVIDKKKKKKKKYLKTYLLGPVSYQDFREMDNLFSTLFQDGLETQLNVMSSIKLIRDDWMFHPLATSLQLSIYHSVSIYWHENAAVIQPLSQSMKSSLAAGSTTAEKAILHTIYLMKLHISQFITHITDYFCVPVN